ETTTCGCRSDTAGRRMVPAAVPPAGAAASYDQGRIAPPARQVPTWSVDPAHAIDGHLFDQGLGDELGRILGLLILLHRTGLSSQSGSANPVGWITISAIIWHRVPKW